MLRTIALAMTAVILIPVGAHLFELYGKIGLPEQAYFNVQPIYAGWSLFAVPIFAAIALNAALAWRLRADRAASVMAGASAVLIALTLAIFFIWVFPGNQATQNWTAVPADWQSLRRSWEWGHATNAVITFVAFLLVAAAATRTPSRN